MDDYTIKHGSIAEKQKLLQSSSLTEQQIIQLITHTGEDLKELFSDLIDYQILTHEIVKLILLTCDYATLYEFFEYIKGEYNIKQITIEFFFKNFEFPEARSALINNFPLPQPLITQLLTNYYDSNEFEDLIHQQSFLPSDFDIIFHSSTAKKLYETYISEGYSYNRETFNELTLTDVSKKIEKIMIWEHPLPDKWIKFFIDQPDYVSTIIEAQQLNSEWLTYFLTDKKWRDRYFDLLRFQIFDPKNLELLFEIDYDVILPSMAKLQELPDYLIEKALKTGEESIIRSILERQQFTDKQRAAFMLEFPQYRTIIKNNRQTRKHLTNQINKTQSRNHRLNSKLPNKTK